MKNILARMDDFLGKTALSQYVSYPERKRIAESLLAEGNRIFPATSGESQKLLEERLDRVRKILLGYRREDEVYHRPVGYPSLRAKRLAEAKTWLINGSISTLPVSDKIAKTKKYFVDLHQIAMPPTEQEKATLNELENLLHSLELRKPRPIYTESPPTQLEIGEPGRGTAIDDIGAPIVPRERVPLVTKPAVFIRADSFYRTMKDKPLLDKASLKSAIERGELLFEELNRELDRMVLPEYKKWSSSLYSEKRGVGGLLTRWKDQVKKIEEREATTRSETWQKEKRAEDMRRYLANKDRAGVLGKTALDSTKALHDAVAQASVILSISQMIRIKVNVTKTPEALPVDRIASSITALESLIGRVRLVVGKGDVIDAESKLNALKREYQIVKKAYGDLSFEKTTEGYKASVSSKGITYFRANLPQGVREALPARNIAKLEDLASKGISGAKEAIVIAIYLVAKRSTKKAKEILERR